MTVPFIFQIMLVMATPFALLGTYFMAQPVEYRADPIDLRVVRCWLIVVGLVMTAVLGYFFLS